METFLRIIKLGNNNFWRNRWLTIGATLLMTLTLIMVSVSLLFSFIVRDSAAQIRSKIDLTMYFRDDAVADSDIQALGDEISQLPEVEGVRFIDKAAALERWHRLPINENIKGPVTVDNNPLPRSLEVNTANPDSIPAVITAVEALDEENLICSECVSYFANKDTVNRLLSVTKFVQRAGILLSVFFGIIAIFNVLNIIRITITARSDEIEIMRYVGASNSFVRGPFVVEGILYGVLGTIVTTIFLLIVSAIAAPYLNSLTFSILNAGFFGYVLAHFWALVLVQFLVGAVLGVVVSVISMRRYLRA